MERWLARLVAGVASILLLGACATAGTRSDLVPTYVMVFTVPKTTFMDQIPQCTNDCSPGRTNPVTMSLFDELQIFVVKDVGFDPRKRKFSEYMYSPQWQQPDLGTAQEWARCVVERFDKPHPKFGKVTITSAYLLQVLAPGDEVKRVQREGLGRSPCEVPELTKWEMRR